MRAERRLERWGLLQFAYEFAGLRMTGNYVSDRTYAHMAHNIPVFRKNIFTARTKCPWLEGTDSRNAVIREENAIYLLKNVLQVGTIGLAIFFVRRLLCDMLLKTSWKLPSIYTLTF